VGAQSWPPAARVEVATAICQVEAPIARRRLYVKISRAFGLSRTVKSREESIRAALGEAFAYFDEDGFVWASRDDALAALAVLDGGDELGDD